MNEGFHTCEIRMIGGARLRMLAYRHNVRELLADFHVRTLAQEERGGPAAIVGDAVVTGFPRGLGVFEMFAQFLSSNNAEGPLRDENGKEVPLPERTAEEWVACGRQYEAMARECYVRASVAMGGGLFPLRGEQAPRIVAPGRSRRR